MSQFDILIVEDEYALARALGHTVNRFFALDRVDIAGDGAEAWDKVLSHHYDLIISDWNMPRKTGEQLLTDVREHEQTRHIPFLMLTGRSDRASVASAAQHGADAYLVKPFAEDLLIGKIEELLKTCKRIDSGNEHASEIDTISVINSIANDLKNGDIKFPILSEVALRITALFNEEEKNLDRIVDTLRLDPSIAPKLIALANSAFYKTAKHITTLEEAVSRLGLKQTKEVALMAVNHGLFNFEEGEFKERLLTLWSHGAAVASCAKHIAQILSADEPETLYLMGMLHDIGKLILIQQLQEQYPSIESEQASEIIQTLHTQVGAAVLREWQLPVEIVEAALMHHDVSHISEASLRLRIIHFADLFSRVLGFSLHPIKPGEVESLCSDLELNLSSKQLEQLANAVNNEVNKLKSAM